MNWERKILNQAAGVTFQFLGLALQQEHGHV